MIQVQHRNREQAQALSRKASLDTGASKSFYYTAVLYVWLLKTLPFMT